MTAICQDPGVQRSDAGPGIVVLGVGDVGPLHEPLDAYSELVRPLLATADVRIGQCERLYSERGTFQVQSGGHHTRLHPDMASVFDDCGFDVVSVASTHAMDWGPDALLDTRALFESRGMAVIGGGRDLAHAREPAIVERSGVTVAVLGYCSVLREGYAATPDKPGVAPLRAHTYYEPTEYQPGTPPRVVTVPYEEDLAGMLTDIARARERADAVILFVHWGVHFIPRIVADYQRVIASAAFGAGVDLILGHHAHVPKAIEVFDGKVCFYSLSNFIMSCPPEGAAHLVQRYGITLDPAYPRLPYGIDAPRTMIARAVIGRDGVRRVSFLPTHIDTHLRPEVLRAGDQRFDDALRYMEWVSEGFAHRFVLDGDEVVVT